MILLEENDELKHALAQYQAMGQDVNKWKEMENEKAKADRELQRLRSELQQALAKLEGLDDRDLLGIGKAKPVRKNDGRTEVLEQKIQQSDEVIKHLDQQVIPFDN